MNIMVTGGAGFVGTNLIKRLLKDGHNVVSLDNYSTGKEENHQEGCKYVDADIRDVIDFDYFMEDVDVVYHLAALARIQPSFKNPANTLEVGIFENQYGNKEPLTITGDGFQRRDFTHIDDIVDGLILTSENETCWDEIELGRGENFSINELADMFNTDIKYIDERPGEARETLCNTLIAKRLIGYEPTRNIKDYIKEVINE